MTTPEEARRGAIATLAAFTLWGIVPIYWKAVGAIPPREMIGHRIFWGLPFLALLLWRGGGFGAVRAVLGNPRHLRVLALSAALVGTNWFFFIEAVAHGQVLEASLGYYINPILNVFLGFALLGERLRPWQWVAVALAGAGVLNQILAVGEVPWVALVLAVTFGLYGLVRKLARTEALPGLFVEVLLLTPLALAGIVWLHTQGEARMPHVGWDIRVLVPIAGLLTALPLWWFAFGARRLRLATVGLLQFIAPTGQFLLAVFVYDEPFTPAHMATFGLIWAGVLLYVVDLQRTPRPREERNRP